MERSRSGEDVSSSDESDPERHMSDNSGSTKPETESNKPETESNLKNVMVLLRRDVHKNDGKVYTPNAKEMTQLKRPEKEQYKTGIKLTWNMTEKNVDEELRRRFPILGNNGRLSCATAADKGTRLEFHNSQGKVWDGSKINRLVRGNRVLYVLFEETSESVFERPDCSPQLQTPTHEPMGKKSRKRRNDGSASAAVCKRTKECSATVVSSIGNSSFPMQLCRVNGRQNGPQGHSSTTTTISQKNISSQNFFLDGLSKASGSQKCAIPVTYTCTRTSSTIGPGHQTQASGGILPSAYPPVSMSSSPNLNFSMQTSVQGCQSQSIVSRDPQIQYHFVQDDLTVGNNILTLSQQGNSIPVADQTDQQHVLQNRNSLLPGTTQSAGSNTLTLDSGNICQRSGPAHPTVGSQWGLQASGILHNDPSKQTAATADPPPISHESDSGLSSTSNNDVGVAIASNSADQSQDTSTHSEIFSSSEEGDSALEEGREMWFESQICGVVKEIFPSSGPILENIRFSITLAQKLPRKYRKLKFKANFEGIGAVPLDIEIGSATLTGNIISHVAGKVKVNVEYEGSSGNSIGFAFFEFIKKNDEVILGELSEVKLGQSVIFNVLQNVLGTIESSGSGIQEATPCRAGGTGVSNVNKRSYALPEKILTLLVYKAAEINGREFLEMVFNTSAGRVIFNYYRKSSTLPGDVARANGHTILGDFLEVVNERLSKICNEDSHETINWLELKHAVEKKVFLPCTDDTQLVSSPDGNDNQSDYEADDEASLLPSPADTCANSDKLDDSEHGDIGQITLDKNDLRNSIATEAERRRHQTGTERQAGSGSLFTNRNYSEMEMESLSHGTDNERYTDAVTNGALHPNQEGADSAEDHFVTSAVMTVGGETSNAIEISSEGGTNSSAERQNQEPTDSMTVVPPCEINAGTLMDPYIQTTTKNTFWKRCCDETDQKEERGNLGKLLGLQDTPTKDMAAAKEYTDEQLNYFKICHVTTVILTEGLRTIFKREWDIRFGTTLGEWKDDPSNGKDFYNGESPRNQRRNKLMLSTMIRGNRAEWDSTMLFYAILFSDCIYSLNRVVRTNVNNLRKFRNEEFAHMPQGQLSELDFKIAISKVSAAFQALGLSTLEIQQITNQKTFPTEELRDVLEKLGTENVEVATSYNNLGLVRHKLGDLEKAKEYHELALSNTQKKLGPENEEVATSYINLGLVHHKLGDFEKAKEYHELALTIRQKKLGPENVQVANSYNDLGYVHEQLGDFKKATEYHELALSIRQKKLGPENVEVATSYHILGSVHEQLGDFEKAKEYRELALGITLKKLGPESVQVATSFINLGLVHYELGDFEKAKEYHELALSITQKKLGPESVQVATTYYNLGSVHEQLGDFEKAKEYHELALSITQKKLGPENVQVATSYNNLGYVHEQLGDFEKAKEYHELALIITWKKLGPENVEVATSYNNLGYVHEQLYDFVKAKEYHELALSIRQKKLGPESVQVATTYYDLGSVHEQLGDFEKAKEYYELALSITQKKLAPENVEVATSYNNLGLVHHKLGDFEKAKEYL